MLARRRQDCRSLAQASDFVFLPVHLLSGMRFMSQTAPDGCRSPQAASFSFAIPPPYRAFGRLRSVETIVRGKFVPFAAKSVLIEG